MIRYSPDVIVLQYTFNDVDYLAPVTPRPALNSIAPIWVAYRNSYLFQEIYVRVRAIRYASRGDVKDPYANETLMASHVADLSEFTNIATTSGAVVGVVPFDISVSNETAKQRYRTTKPSFVKRLEENGVPVWPAIEPFERFDRNELIVNSLDHHPNEAANDILAKHLSAVLLLEVYSEQTNDMRQQVPDK